MMNRWVRFIVVSPLYATLLFLFVLELGEKPFFIVPGVLIFSVLSGILVVFARRIALVCLGVGLCVMPMFGSGTLNVFLGIWLLALELRRLFRGESPVERYGTSEKSIALAFFVFFLALFGGALHTFVLESDPYLCSTIFDSSGLMGLGKYLIRHFSEWGNTSLIIAGYVLCALLMFSLVEIDQDGEDIGGVFFGLATGSLISVAVLVLQYLGVHPIFSLTRSTFWDFTGRYSASFSDPNAFGLMAVLLIPVLFLVGRGWWRWYLRGCSVLLLLSVPWSGSRTVWLGLLLWLAILIFRASRQPNAFRFRRAALVVGGILVIGVIVCGYPPVNHWLQQSSPAPGVTRLLKTCHWKEGYSMFASRSVYSRIALAMWWDNPLVGVGLGRFYGEQERVADTLGIELGGWRDNANNFYLQFLAETGIVGFSLILFSFYLFGKSLAGRAIQDLWSESPKRTAPSQELASVASDSLMVMVLLLLTGPHFFFDEVRYLTTLLYAVAVTNVLGDRQRNVGGLWTGLLFVAVVCSVVFMFVLGRGESARYSKGFYTREYSETEGFFAWSGKRARLAICRDDNGPLVLQMKALNPDLKEKPLSVGISRFTRAEQRMLSASYLELRDYHWKAVHIERRGDTDDQDILMIEVDRVWSPSQGDPEGDVRWLGVMIKWPENVCGEVTGTN